MDPQQLCVNIVATNEQGEEHQVIARLIFYKGEFATDEGQQPTANLELRIEEIGGTLKSGPDSASVKMRFVFTRTWWEPLKKPIEKPIDFARVFTAVYQELTQIGTREVILGLRARNDKFETADEDAISRILNKLKHELRGYVHEIEGSEEAAK